MGIIFYGAKETAITVDEWMVKCPCCETHNRADTMIMSRYYHIYWVPIFPFDKPVNVICQKCGFIRTGISMNADLVSNYEEIKRKCRHPWFTYAGVGVFAIIILSLIITFYPIHLYKQ